MSLQVVPGRRDDFLKAIEENAERSFTDEPGCRFFDVVCDLADDHHLAFGQGARSFRAGVNARSRGAGQG
ncbi:putative quinol monooxygenase [Streptomyces sp. NPDC096132]|uniref:putative quinol monooxygenase n=1 Tax=Streptomyces sp. NPDC096132 TaxID=3366075 RepID=UPI00382E6804